MTVDSHPNEQAPGTASEAPESASTPEVGVSGGSDPLNGPQTGTESLDGDPQPRGAIYWARKQAAEREAQRAAGRPTAATITQQQLDALYNQLDQLREDLAEEKNTSARRKRILDRRRPELQDAEAAVERMREAAQWLRRNYPGLTQLHSRLDAALDAGPSVAECAQVDRAHWTAKYAGEGQ
ncbi:hypothetical protein ABTZ58_10100 [Streptomyces sp. NPDC094143]|uniref:hypothetical protein n=1 Tax=Streptomyces sp. NPDC094143 TaxID=3155310 RepID=UPI003332B55A